MSDIIPEIPRPSKVKRPTTLGYHHWMTIDQVATYIGASRAWTARQLLAPHVPIPVYVLENGTGKSYRFKQSDVDEWMENYRSAIHKVSPIMSALEFNAAMRLLRINNYFSMAKALGCDRRDVWAYMQGVEAVPATVAEQVREIFYQRRIPFPPARY